MELWKGIKEREKSEGGEVKSFTVKPRYWWTYLNPFWWRRKRILEELIAYQWEHGGEEFAQNKLLKHILYEEVAEK